MPELCGCARPVSFSFLCFAVCTCNGYECVCMCVCVHVPLLIETEKLNLKAARYVGK